MSCGTAVADEFVDQARAVVAGAGLGRYSSAMRAKASASFALNAAPLGRDAGDQGGDGRGSRFVCRLHEKLSGSSITSSAGVVRTTANWAMRLRRGSAPKESPGH